MQCFCLIYLWILHGLHCAIEGGAQRGKADHYVNLEVLLHSVGHVLVDRNQDFLVAPVKLLLVIATRKHGNGRE